MKNKKPNPTQTPKITCMNDILPGFDNLPLSRRMELLKEINEFVDDHIAAELLSDVALDGETKPDRAPPPVEQRGEPKMSKKYELHDEACTIFFSALELEKEYDAVNNLLERLRRTNKALADQLEADIGLLVTEAMEQGFAYGWQCAKMPELLLFKNWQGDL